MHLSLVLILIGSKGSSTVVASFPANICCKLISVWQSPGDEPGNEAIQW